MKLHTDPAIPPRAGRVFTADDQALFARLSGDVNPMHMDPLAARRLLSGRQVVHGIHLLLAMLEAGPPFLSAGGATLECEFPNPVSVGDPVCFDYGDDGTSTASVLGMACTLLRRQPSPAPTAQADAETAGAVHIAQLEVPLERAPAEWVGRLHTVDLAPGDFAQHFPQACARIGEPAVRALATLSYIVGMVCPGLNSIFSSLKLTQLPVSGAADRVISFRVLRYDPRFRLMVIGVGGCVHGEIRAFVRPPPQSQESAAALALRVNADEFAGKRALVIGGSRGLGEVCAKLVCAGGGDVVLTYAQGADDAQRVADDIHAAGRGGCRIERFVAGALSLQGVLQPGEVPDAVFFFATPKIFQKRQGVFDRALFDEFCGCYVDAFAQLCAELDALVPARPIRVFVPSSTAVAERPRGMTEYAMAKAAAELLADDLGRALTNVSFVTARIPRLATDQTSTLVAVKTESNVDVLLPFVRRVCV